MGATRMVLALGLISTGSTYIYAYVESMIKAKLSEQHTDLKPADSKKKTVSIEQIEKLGKKISKMQEKYQKAEST